MKYIVPFLLLTAALFLQASAFSAPLILAVLIASTVVFKDYSSFLFAVLFGILFDILAFATIGKSAIFFTVLIFIIFSYQKKFEITTNYFVILVSFFASAAFSLIYGLQYLALQAIISIIFGVIVFQFLKKIGGEQITNSKSQITNNF